MQNWEGKLYLTENLLSRNKMWFVVDNCSYIHTVAHNYVQKNFRLNL